MRRFKRALFVKREAIKPAAPAGGETDIIQEVPENASEDHPRVHRVQAAQLQHHEKQKKRPRQAGDEQVLPLLPQAHGSQGNEVRA
jgi:hypothetical protein